jgi:predicted transposase YbfD/YdcC
MVIDVMERLKERFAPIAKYDPRVKRRRRHLLVDIVVIAVCGVLSGCDSFVEIERYGRQKLDFFRKFLELPHGIPSHDTFGRVFARLKPEAFQECLWGWLGSFRGSPKGDVIPIDGKTLRHTFDTAAKKTALHSVSAWSTKYRLTLGQVAVAAKSNEITAIPQLLKLLDVNGAIVTIDAMGCQKDIAAEIREQRADYVLALKGNHEQLHAAVQTLFAERLESGLAEQGPGDVRRAEKNHGRHETRHVYALPAPPTLPGFAEWKDLRSLAMVISHRTVNGRETDEVRYYLASLPPRARKLSAAIRTHWNIENTQHWTLDVAFREDDRRNRKDHSPENLAVVNRFALSLLQQDTTTKVGIKCKRNMCGWNDHCLLQILAGQPAK